MPINNTKIAVALLAVAALGGCASTSEMDTLRAEVRQANETAASAQQTAQHALAAAEAAERKAAAAQRTADEASADAQTVNTKIDRMFKKTMYK